MKTTKNNSAYFHYEIITFSVIDGRQITKKVAIQARTRDDADYLVEEKYPNARGIKFVA